MRVLPPTRPAQSAERTEVDTSGVSVEAQLAAAEIRELQGERWADREVSEDGDAQLARAIRAEFAALRAPAPTPASLAVAGYTAVPQAQSSPHQHSRAHC